MTAQVPTKIVLKSTTKMSLNDRFTSIQQQTRQQPTVQNIRASMAAQQQASAANRRLAQQLANRPGIGMMNMAQQQPINMSPRYPSQPPQRSLQQRLGKSNIKARLNLEAVGRGGGMQQGRGRGFMQWGRDGRGRGQSIQTPRGASRGRGNIQRGRGSPRGVGNYPVRGGRGRGRGGFLRFPDEDLQSSNRWRGRGQGRRDRRRGGRNQGERFPGRGGNRGGRGAAGRGQNMRGRGRGRGGRGRGRGGSVDQVSKEQLDNQLDEYMSKTKSYLNSELDAYMAEANP
ncbi:hypothetical protein C0Q70_03401 [Pomacea canaliculata]|uniref:Chromatin target of PRMT1 protein C-terminal domain-containing protein n=1 Tax=Pomacea canaliculata TaxID=400727 RepID=A0A2T7PSL3_POMCA|nr:chromatin target of PRMT1 protein-like isoform X2 [Pomacea canaliculata]PVD36418.1 hypothetical protein C0Q70_03401 [Pomacea canaliculata]